MQDRQPCFALLRDDGEGDRPQGGRGKRGSDSEPAQSVSQLASRRCLVLFRILTGLPRVGLG